MLWGCTGNGVGVQVVARAVYKADVGGNGLLQDVNSEHFVSGVGCSEENKAPV